MHHYLTSINYLAVLVAAVVNMFVGAAWYSPPLFAKPWMAELGLRSEDMAAKRAEATRGYIIAIVCSLLIAFALALLVHATRADSAADGFHVGFLSGAGFAATAMAASYGFEGRSRRLFLINAGYPIVAYAIMGTIIGAWQ